MAKANAKKISTCYRQRANGTIEMRKWVTLSDGTHIQKSFYGRTKTICKQKYEEWMRNDKKERVIRETVQGFAETWTEIKRSEVSYRTWKNYDRYLWNYIVKYLGGNRQLNSIKPMDISLMMSKCADLSDSAKHHILLTTNQFFKAAMKNGLCRRNPCEDVKYHKTDELKELEVFTPEELEILIQNLQNTPIGIGIALMLFAGLRTEEVCALHWSDVDLDNDVIKVSRVITITGDREFSDIRIPKSKKIRRVPIPTQLHDLLKAEKKVKGCSYVMPYKAGKKTHPYQYPFYTPNVFFERYEKFFRSLPIRYLSPHKLRHTYGTYLVRGGADLPSIQKLLGHSSVNTTRIYTDVDLSDQRNAVAKLSFA